VIDACGRASAVPRWLAAHGVAIHTLKDPTPFFYLTRHYRLRAGVSFPSVRLPIIVALAYATLLAFPEDNGSFQLTVQLDVSDPSKRFLRDPAVFDRFLARTPLMAPWLEAGEATSAPEPLASAGNGWKRTYDQRPLVTGLLLVGDAAVYTNPTAGRGVALALAHAQALADFLDQVNKQPCDLAMCCARWEQTTAHLYGPWFDSQVQTDRSYRKQVRASLQGRRCEKGDDGPTRLASALAARHDCDVLGAAADRLFNLLVTPAEVYSDRALMRRVLSEARRASPPAQAGPSREEYERLVIGLSHARR
jgi:hypothetical protein